MIQKKKAITKLIKRGNKLTKKEIQFIIDFVKSNGGIEYSMEKAYEYSKSAIEAIAHFPDSASKQSLINFSRFVVERKLE